MAHHRRAAVLVLVVILVTCGGDDVDEGGSNDTTDTGNQGRDTGRRDSTTEDSSVADTSQENDPITAVDIQVGDGGFGEACTQDSDCTSELCLATQYGDVCTTACDAMTDCELAGLNCVLIRNGVTACAPDQTTLPANCADHSTCPYPYTCQAEFSWCALPECTWDADCGAGEECQPLARRCQPNPCASDVDCEDPTERCVDDACGPPQCTDSEQCDGIDYCHPIQLRCRTPDPCGEEDSCPYSEACDAGYCYPNLCHAGCDTVGHQCNPLTGDCGASCETNANCPAGQACGTASHICYANEPPFADAVAAAGADGSKAANVSVGQTVQLSGEGSVDPEGEPLSYRWVVNATAAGSSFAIGQELGTSATVDITVDQPGVFAVGLWVTDPGGLTSFQDQVALWVQ